MCRGPGVVLRHVSRVARPLHILVQDAVRHVLVVERALHAQGRREPLRIEVPAVRRINIHRKERITLYHCPACRAVPRFIGGTRHQAHPLASIVPYGVVHLRQPRARVHLPTGVVGFLALRRLQRPFPSVVGHAGQFALPVHRLDVIRDDAPAEHIRVSVVDGEVVKKRQVFQAADDDVVVILLQDRLRHPLQHADAPLIAGKVPPSLPFLVHRVAPSGHHHQRFWRMVHAARHLFVRIEHHTERVGRCVHRQDAHPTRIKTPAARCQVVDHAIDDIMFGKGGEVVLPSLTNL